MLPPRFLAAVIIGQASAQAGQAALAAGLAASQQSAINFTRGNEVEADRIGIEILANADYDPRAMAETFDILRRQNSLNTSGLVLEYLRTHPLDTNRIAEASDRAAVKPEKERVNSVEFNLFKARLAVLGSTDQAQTMRIYKSRYQRLGDAQSAYALALVSQRNNRMSEAKDVLRGTGYPDSRQSDGGASTRRYTRLLTKTPPIDWQLYQSFIPNGTRSWRNNLMHWCKDANCLMLRTLQHATFATNQQPNPLAWRQLASIQQQLDDEAGSHESLARYFEALDELERAQGQLELALREVPAGSQDEIRLTASLRNLKDKAAELQ